MRRREIIGFLGGAAAMPLFAPLAALAQDLPGPPSGQPSALPEESSSPKVPLPRERVHRLGVLVAERRDRETLARLDALNKALAAKGWTEGRNLQVEVRWSADDRRRLTNYAVELAGLSPDLVLATDRATAKALQAAGGGVPMVFLNVTDPVGAGLVQTLEQPGGNATGISRTEYGASTAWPELLKRIAPNVMRVAIIRDPDVPSEQAQVAAILDVAPAVGLEAFALDVDNLRELERAIAGFSRTPNGGLIVSMSNASSRDRGSIVRLAARYKLPAVYADPEFVAAGGLVSYAPDLRAQYRLAADYADRILRGEKPAELPVQASARLRTAINLKAAKALKLTVPPALLEIAQEAME